MAEEAKVPVVEVPAEPRYPDGSLIKKGAQSAEFWPTEAKALEIAKGREKGARRVCKVVDKAGKIRYATTTHPHYLEEYILTVELGWQIEEVGKPSRAATPATADEIMKAIAAISNEEERKKLNAQVADFLKQSKK